MSTMSHGRPTRVKIDESTAGDRTIVSAITDRQIVVLNYLLTIASNTVHWESGTTEISGPFTESHMASADEAGILETAKGEALVLNLVGTGQVSGFLSYVVK